MGESLSGLGAEYADEDAYVVLSDDMWSEEDRSSEDSDTYSEDYGLTPWHEYHLVGAGDEFELTPDRMLFADFEELEAFMSRASHTSSRRVECDLVELCGGGALTTKLAVKAGLQGGRNFDLIVG
eukprot:1421995-Amphidinium_carterae.1